MTSRRSNHVYQANPSLQQRRAVHARRHAAARAHVAGAVPRHRLHRTEQRRAGDAGRGAAGGRPGRRRRSNSRPVRPSPRHSSPCSTPCRRTSPSQYGRYEATIEKLAVVFTGAKNASSLTHGAAAAVLRPDQRGGRRGHQAPRHQDQSAVRAARRGPAHHQPATEPAVEDGRPRGPSAVSGLSRRGGIRGRPCRRSAGRQQAGRQQAMPGRWQQAG